MKTISMEEARLEDAAEMAPNMRAEDVAEVLASGGYSPLGALEDSILMSAGNAWTVRYNGEIMAIWGTVVTNLLAGEVVPWLLTTYVVEKHPKAFFKISKNAVWGLRRQYNKIANRIDARYTAAIRWAKHLGFTVEDTGQPFVKISMRGA